jgi:cap1 methyltransferase
MFTEFSVGLFYLLYRCFRRVALFKPVTSRPANSERYVICQGLRDGTESVANYMYVVNEELCRLSGTRRDITEVVPLSLMKRDEVFSTYMRAFNDSFGIHQVTHLQKIQYFVKNSSLQDSRQAQIRKSCLKLWQVPDNPRTTNTDLEKPDQIFTEHWLSLYGSRAEPETRAKMEADLPRLKSESFAAVTRDGLDFLRCLHSWRWSWASGKRMMVVGLGRNRVSGWDMKGDKLVFTHRSEMAQLELPPGTVLEVELVQELEREGPGQRKHRVIYILDVLAINKEFYGWRPLKERMQYARKLAKVLSKPCGKSPLILRAKVHHRVTDLCSQDTYPKLEMKLCKGSSWKLPTVPVSDCPSRFLVPVGVMFFKIIRDPWQLHSGRKGLYFYNAATKTSQYECPPTSVASFLDVLKSRHLWMWERGIFEGLCEVGEDGEEGEGSGLTRRTLSATLSHFMTQHQ